MDRQLDRLYNRIQNLLQNGGLVYADDSGPVQRVQVRLNDGESADGVDHLQPYGLTNVPHEGAEHVTAFLGGNRDLPIVILVGDRRYRLQPLETGDVALYSSGKNYAIMRASGDIEVYGPANTSIKTDGNLSIEAGGSIDITSGGDTTITTGGNLNLNQ